jgi:hypothetical protein
VRTGFVITNVHMHAPRVGLLRHAEGGLQCRLTCALHGQLHAGTHQHRQCSQQQVQALLRREPADDGQQQ